MHEEWDSDSALDVAHLTGVTVSTTERRMTAQVRAMGQTGDDANAEPGEDCEIQQPLGLMARPIVTARTEAVYLRRGDELVITCVLDTGREPQAVEAGETRLYGAGADNQHAVVRIRANGDVEITAASGRDVIVNGGSAKVNREGDAVDLGAWTFIPGTGGASLSYTPPGGAPTTITTATAVGGKTGAGAAHFKG